MPKVMQIAVEPLTKHAFRSFGEVVEVTGAERIGINQGFAERVNGLAAIDVASGDGHVNISLFEARQRVQPIKLVLMERHPLGSQLFYPLQDRDWIVVVCGDPFAPATFHAFRASGRQGVNYARGVWHHPLIVLTDNERFLVVDRGGGEGSNLEEVALPPEMPLQLAI